MCVSVFLINMHISNSETPPHVPTYVYTQKVELAYHSRCLLQKTCDPNNQKPGTLNMQF